MRRYGPVTLPHQTPVNPPTGHVSVGVTATGAPNFSLRGTAGAPLPAIGWTHTSPLAVTPGNNYFLPGSTDLNTTAGVWTFGFVIRTTATVSGEQISMAMWADTTNLTWMVQVVGVEDDTGSTFTDYKTGSGISRPTFTNSVGVSTWYFEGMAEFSGPGWIWPACNNAWPGATGTVTVQNGSHGHIGPVS